MYNGEYILLCRVAESVRCDRERFTAFPIVVERGGKLEFDVMRIEKSKHPEFDFSDSRTICKTVGGRKRVMFLTSLSHLRIARSADGVHFQLEQKPFLMPDPETECWGMEDPRIVQIGDLYYINYTAVSPNGAATALISTADFTRYERHGTAFLPENKDVAIFPQKFRNKYLAFNRPVPYTIGNADIWISESPDMLHWGGHRHFYGTAEDGWESGKIGGGAPPVLTKAGWVKIYHAVDKNQRYSLGAFLLDRENPLKIIAKSKVPLLQPEADYEKTGFFGNVVFTCGCILEQDMLIIYYGAADDKVCRADIRLEDLYRHLGL